MAREYVPIFFEWLEVTQDLTQEQKGNLVDAAVLYASGGDWEKALTGVERIAFRFIKGQIDRNTAISDLRSTASRNKREQTPTNDNKTEQNETNDNKTEQTTTKSPKEKEKDKEKDKEKKKEKEERERALQENFDLFWALYPRKESKPEAQRAFAKIDPDVRLLQDMLDSIEKWKQSSQWQERQYIPYPATWLHNRKWEDEPPASTPPAPKPSPAASEYKQRNLTGADAEATRRMLDWLDGGEL